jgi:hypothetical protein
MIRNNFEPEGAMLELGLLSVSCATGSGSGTVRESDDNDGTDIVSQHKDTTPSTTVTVGEDEIVSECRITLLDKILNVATGRYTAHDNISSSGATFLMSSVVEWGDESPAIASIVTHSVLYQQMGELKNTHIT